MRLDQVAFISFALLAVLLGLASAFAPDPMRVAPMAVVMAMLTIAWRPA